MTHPPSHATDATTAVGESDSVLTDGEHEVSRSARATVVQSLIGQLREQGVGPTDYLEFRCEHDLASALLALALLDAGHSAFVSASDARVPKTEAPAFCRLSVRAAWEGTLRVVAEERPGWNGARVNGEPRLIFRTSGSTGAAKLVAHSVHHLQSNATNCVERLQLRSTDRLVIPVPVYHMYGFGAAFLPGALAGASMEFQPASNVLRYVEREKQFRPNIAFLTPGYLETLVKARRSPRHYELTVVAGDILKPGVSREYESRFGPVVSLYGSTEMGAIAAASRLDTRDIRERTVGRPLTGVECRIDGQLWCRHPYGFEGYADGLGNIHSRASGEWFPTSDRAEWHEGEWLRILGRVDDSVKRDGVLVALADVEAAMQRITDVSSAVAVAAGTSPRGRGVFAFCTLAAGARLNADDVRRACFEWMPRSHVPDRVEVVGAIPTLASGKPDRPTLTRMAEEMET